MEELHDEDYGETDADFGEGDDYKDEDEDEETSSLGERESSKPSLGVSSSLTSGGTAFHDGMDSEETEEEILLS